MRIFGQLHPRLGRQTAAGLAMTALAIPISLLCAIASWHLVEKPAIARVDALAACVRGGMARLVGGRGPSESGRSDFEPSH